MLQAQCAILPRFSVIYYALLFLDVMTSDCVVFNVERELVSRGDSVMCACARASVHARGSLDSC
jgi:hypothetical protein